MSIISLQIGQCGNQIGYQFYKSLIDDLFHHKNNSVMTKDILNYNELCLERFFWPFDDKLTSCFTPRSLMIDMESKVISKIIQDANKEKTWSYNISNQVTHQKGSGNNWAHGFCFHGSNIEEQVSNILQAELEKCDRVGGFISFMSLAGGTGSGVGAFISKCLKDNFPKYPNISQVIWPYVSGEVAVQNYNAVLSLSNLLQTTDAIIGLDNDSIHKICTTKLGIEKVSFEDMNMIIANLLRYCFSPAFQKSSFTSKPNYINNVLNDFLEALVFHPEYKLVTISMAPYIPLKSLNFTSYHWKDIITDLIHSFTYQNSELIDGRNINKKIFSNILISRGVEDFLSANSVLLYKLKPIQTYIDQNINIWTHSRNFNKYEKSVFMASNDSCQIKNVDRVVSRAWDMFNKRAYIHQYKQWGLEDDDFIDSFAYLEQLILNYSKI